MNFDLKATLDQISNAVNCHVIDNLCKEIFKNGIHGGGGCDGSGSGCHPTITHQSCPKTKPKIKIKKIKKKLKEKGSMLKIPPQEKERKTKVVHFDVTLSPLALHCLRVSLM